MCKAIKSHFQTCWTVQAASIFFFAVTERDVKDWNALSVSRSRENVGLRVVLTWPRRRHKMVDFAKCHVFVFVKFNAKYGFAEWRPCDKSQRMPHDSLQCYQEYIKEEELLGRKKITLLLQENEERSLLMRIMDQCRRGWSKRVTPEVI